MNRRAFIAALAGAASWPVGARAQPSPQSVVGFLSGRSPNESNEVLGAFHRGLAENGYVEGSNIAIEYRWAEGRYDKLPMLAADLIGRRVAAIAATGGSVSGLAAKAATTTIPIVFSSGGDAVALGLVPNLNRPGGNVTGVNLIFGALGGKRLDLLHELVPQATAIGVLLNPNYPSAANEVTDVQAAARGRGLSAVVFNAGSETEIDRAFSSMTEHKVTGLLVADDPFLQAQRDRLSRLAASHALPAIYFSRDFADAGGLMSYGPSINDAYRLVGVYIGRILKGERPGDLPVLQPTKFELVINLKTAKAIGVDVPATLLARADEVIE